MLGIIGGGFVFGMVFMFKILPNMKKDKSDKDEYMATTQDNLVFKDIRNGITELKNGGFRMHVEVPGVNVELMDDSEIETVFFIYKEILNSIEFDFQIVQQSKVLDISEYLELLDSKIKLAPNPVAERELEVYREFVRGAVDEYSILTKKMYVVIPYDEEKESKKNVNYKKYREKERAVELTEEQKLVEENERFKHIRRELEMRANFVQQSFLRLGVEAHVLTNEEVFDLYYTAYNKDKSIVQPMYRRNPKQLTTLRVKFEPGGEG